VKLLIIRLSAFGDIIHTLPLAENAHRAGAEVGWLCESRYHDLLQGNPNIDRLFLADTRAWRADPVGPRTWADIRRLRRDLRAFAPDRTIDAQGLWKSALLARSAGAPVVGFAASERREGSSALLCAIRVGPPSAARHIVDRNLALLSPVGIAVERRAPDATYLLSPENSDAAAFLAAQPRPFALYHPGASRPEKAWGEEKFAQLARRLEQRSGLYPVLSWGPGDEARVERLSEGVAGARRLPLLPPRGLAQVMREARIFIGGDTGPLHLADAVGARTLALFGRTDPGRNGPCRGAAIRYDASTTPETVVERVAEVLK
jgi:heptosyltransferase I